ncbi:exo-beta-N-acetylmuramidase NamZ domain-containing protein [Brevibacillus sp. SYSU BS000544]|uniref:exo-beta-N-acetylmuramidase NamZ domain-containing protein n=1 Tax=Brevibacillus sp. SYSU BS000544 TaxID=3416443 RepID=UPI003CE50F73
MEHGQLSRRHTNRELRRTKPKGRVTVRQVTAFLVFVTMLLLTVNIQTKAATSNIKLGDDVLLTRYHEWIDGKRLGLVTNQTGVNSRGESVIQALSGYKGASLKALYAPEHGLDGKAKPGQYVESYMHPELQIPVYSLYGSTRMPSEEMVKEIDVLLIDLQDIGARSDTYLSTLQYCMVAAQKYKKEVIVLDRPNPLGGIIVDGPMLKDAYQSFVGVDHLPMAHGMTIGELAQYFNRKIGVSLRIAPMEGYTRRMIFQDTGLIWVQRSPAIPDLQAVWGYMATGLGEGTGMYQADSYQWVGGKGIDADQFANLLNQEKLPGVSFTAEYRGADGGVRLTIENAYSFNPAKTGIYVLAIARQLSHFPVPKSGRGIVMFDKIMGSNEIGLYLEQGYSPLKIEALYAKELEQFRVARNSYLIYDTVNHHEDGQTKAHVTIPGAMENGNKMYAPMRLILEEFGYQVRWDSTANQLIAAKPDHKNIVMEPGKKPMVVTINGEYVDTKGAALLRSNDTLYMPLSLLALFEKGVISEKPGVATFESHNKMIHLKSSIKQVKGVADSGTPSSSVTVPAKPQHPVTPVPAPPVQSSEKVAYLTFDDGPSKVTLKVLNILKQEKVPATFFIVGKSIKGNEGILKQTVAEGHSIGNHTFSHNYKAIYRDRESFMKDVEAGNQAIEKVIGYRPTMFRFPGGSNNTVSKKAQNPAVYGKDKWIMYELVDAIKASGYQYFDWNVSSGDASGMNYTASEAIAQVKGSSKNKRELVILLHDAASKENTANALPEIISYLKAQGYTFKVLDHNSKPYSLLKVKPAQPVATPKK